MSQIFRIIKPEMIQICRFYGSQRNLHSHYETLRITPDASQKDIRLAFIKLSKEMHPDLSKKSSHTDFVKVNEAYKVLSKEYTRRIYDMELNNRGPDGRPIRVVYYDPSMRDFYPRPTMRPHDPNDDNIYGIKGIKKLSKLKIVFICIVLSAIGLAVQVLAINKSMAFRREALLAESRMYAETYRKVRTEAQSKDHAERIADFETSLKTGDSDTEVELQS